MNLVNYVSSLDLRWDEVNTVPSSTEFQFHLLYPMVLSQINCIALLSTEETKFPIP